MVAARHSVSRILAQSQASLYVCRSCRHQLSRPSILTQQRRFVSNEGSQTSKRKTWNTNDLAERDSRRGVDGKAGRTGAGRQADSGLSNEEVKPALAPFSQPPLPSQEAPESSLNTEVEEYIPAETWDGLQYVGYTGDWRELDPKPSDEFSAWLDSTFAVAVDRSQLVSCLHQAMVECLTCSQAGLNPNSVLQLDSMQLHRETVNAYAAATISISEPGQLSQVQFASDAQAQDVVETLAAVHAETYGEKSETDSQLYGEAQVEAETDPVDTQAAEVQPEESLAAVQSNALNYHVTDESFLRSHLVMEDPITFTILKRFSQLAGHRIPDPALNTFFSSNKPLSFLIEQLDETVVRPKPTKIADILMNDPTLRTQSNVLIFPRRETSVDKEKEVGRWKVIEKELRDRGLPVLGKLQI